MGVSVAYANTQTGEVHYVVKLGGAQTDTELVAAPASGYQILLMSWAVSASADAEWFMEQGAALVAGGYVKAAGRMGEGHSQNDQMGSLGGRELVAATNLTFTTVGVSDAYVDIVYKVVAA
jgi:hypothetical protein